MKKLSLCLLVLLFSQACLASPIDFYETDITAGWFIGASVSHLWLDSPQFEFGTKNNTSTVAMNFADTNDSTFVPHIHFGYQYSAPIAGFEWLGQTPVMRVDIAYFNSKNTHHSGGTSSSVAQDDIYPIDGSNSLSATLTNSGELDTTFRQLAINAILEGNQHLSTQVSFKPFVTGGFNYFRQGYNFRTTDPNLGSPLLYTLDEETKSYSLAAGLGGELDWQQGRTLVFVNGKALGVFSHANLKGSQFIEGANVNGPNFSRTDSMNTLSYRLGLATGITYKFGSRFATRSPKLSLIGGLEHWGFAPGIVNPVTSGKKAKIKGFAENRYYVLIRYAQPL